MMTKQLDVISPQVANDLFGLFRERCKRSPDKIAYRYYDKQNRQWLALTWQQMADQIDRVHAAMRANGLGKGNHIAIMLPNCVTWVMFEQAAFSCGMVVVPLYTNDRGENIKYILEHAEIDLLVIAGKEHWTQLKLANETASLKTIVTVKPIPDCDDPRVIALEEWLHVANPAIHYEQHEADELATIVYTSGTTGRPKGVMLSHYNILSNAFAATGCTSFYTDDVYLSFLPLSHMFERTVGYYMPMLTGGEVVYARSIDQLAEDLQTIRPTRLVTVPRIFERVYNKIHSQLEQKSPLARALFNKTVEIGWHRFLYRQKRKPWHPKLLFWPLLNSLVASKIIAKLGGRIRLAISGGAPLAAEVGKTFIALGLEITQGYGMTELSPVVSTNLLHDNEPSSVGQVFPGLEVKLGENDELLVRGPNVMLSYWKNPEATQQTIDHEGWVHTGDKARIERDHIYITGRIKEILVLSNGEKVPPADLELEICGDPLFEQILIIGEGKPFLSALVVINRDIWQDFAVNCSFDPDSSDYNHPDVVRAILRRISTKLTCFPGYTKIYKAYLTDQSWTVENDLMTPTLKLKRDKIIEYYQSQISAMYEGH